MINPKTLQFLKQLSKHNNKPWFDDHRAQYEDARNDMEKFIQSVIDKHSLKDTDLTGLTARKCLFRINRDVRFSKNKQPYKTNFGASMDRGGKKSGFAGYYFHLEKKSDRRLIIAWKNLKVLYWIKNLKRYMVNFIMMNQV